MLEKALTHELLAWNPERLAEQLGRMRQRAWRQGLEDFVAGRQPDPPAGLEGPYMRGYVALGHPGTAISR